MPERAGCRAIRLLREARQRGITRTASAAGPRGREVVGGGAQQHAAEVAALVAFVAGPESSFINGANLTVDGGTNA
jgi:NAD(P)-dependent dehydrogenase (short-subunit alcohol dehydrogenase family)